MGIRTDVCYGYGFKVTVSEEKMRQFILNHSGTVLEIKDGYQAIKIVKEKKDTDIIEFLFDHQCYISGVTGCYGIIADVMRKETNISFEYDRDDDGTDVVMLSNALPWQMTEAERKITKVDELKDIIIPYMKELGISGSPDYQRVENIG